MHAELVDDLRALLAYASASGAPRELIDRAAAWIVDVALTLDDPRRRRTAQLAQRVARARARGATVAELCERFGKSRATIYRLLWSHDYTRQIGENLRTASNE